MARIPSPTPRIRVRKVGSSRLSLSSASSSFSALRSSSSSSIFMSRQTSPTDISSQEMNAFVQKTLPECVSDKELMTAVQDRVQSFHRDCSDSLADLDHYFKVLLEETPNIPAPVVAQLHTFCGLIQLRQGNSAAAVESFTRALWLQTHLLKATGAGTNNKSEESQSHLLIALAEHRLGVAYGRNKQYCMAINQLKQAIQSYEEAQVSISDGCYVSAKEDLHEFLEARELALVANSGRMRRWSQLGCCKACS